MTAPDCPYECRWLGTRWGYTRADNDHRTGFAAAGGGTGAAMPGVAVEPGGNVEAGLDLPDDGGKIGGPDGVATPNPALADTPEGA